MQGYVARKGQQWYAVVYAGLDPATGRERRRWQAAGTDRADAERLARQLAGEERARRGQGRSRLTFAGFVARHWLPAKKMQLRPTTIEGYERMLRLHILPTVGAIPLGDLRADAVQNLRRTGDGRPSTCSAAACWPVAQGSREEAGVWVCVLRRCAPLHPRWRGPAVGVRGGRCGVQRVERSDDGTGTRAAGGCTARGQPAPGRHPRRVYLLRRYPAALASWEDASGPPERAMHAAWWAAARLRGVRSARANKLLHRIRPDVFPLYDNLTGPLLGPQPWGAVRDDLDRNAETFAALHARVNTHAAMTDIVAPGLLRLHDILLWCHAARRREYAAGLCPGDVP